jgi:ABC-type lipoprotein release transport system permease subunit
MKGALTVLPLLLRIAFRNLFVYKVKTIIIAMLLMLGTFIGVFGLTLLSDIERSMRAGIVESVAGDLQVYSDEAKDDLALFGGAFMGRPDIGTFPDLAKISEIVLGNSNVKSFVPMGTDFALLGRGNEMDESIDGLRKALKEQEAELIASRWDQVKFLLEQLKSEITEKRKVYRDFDELDKQTLSIEKASTFEFGLNDPAEEKLQFLETKVAPISGEKPPIYLGYLGVDVEKYYANFKKFSITEGKALPVGQRGILLSKKIRETQLKNLVARLFDKLIKRTQKSGVAIAGDAENERDAADLPRQYAQILGQLDHKKSIALSAQLTDAGFVSSGDLVTKLTSQIKSFLTVDDKNIVERNTWFYANIAPLIELYQISAGDTIILRSYTRSGFLKSVPLKVFGVFTFQGVEDSDIAGALNLMDLVSFRELYGQMTQEARDELSGMRAASGIQEVSAENAEQALFGADSAVTLETRKSASDKRELGTIQIQRKETLTYPPAEVETGLALSGAIVLKDPAQIDTTRSYLLESFKKAGLKVRVVSWQDASGIVGQFVNLTRAVLIFALFIILVVALVIINNSIVVATMGRVQEIGTLRAIGAQREFVLGLFLVETGLTAAAGAAMGGLLALIGLVVLSKIGIPATTDVVTFLFSGPRLYPTITWEVMFAVPVIVATLATLTSLYAARHAAHIQPVDAMQDKE